MIDLIFNIFLLILCVAMMVAAGKVILEKRERTYDETLMYCIMFIASGLLIVKLLFEILIEF